MIMNVNVSRRVLLEKVSLNREAHRAVLEEALAGWRRVARQELTILTDKVGQEKYPRLHVNLPLPEDHSGEYDAAISMLEASVDDTIEISFDDYRQLALDQWGWKRDWVGTTSTYLGG